jgi:hypothetical protein
MRPISKSCRLGLIVVRFWARLKIGIGGVASASVTRRRVRYINMKEEEETYRKGKHFLFNLMCGRNV